MVLVGLLEIATQPLYARQKAADRDRGLMTALQTKPAIEWLLTGELIQNAAAVLRLASWDRKGPSE
jgi:hypothetical protein